MTNHAILATLLPLIVGITNRSIVHAEDAPSKPTSAESKPNETQTMNTTAKPKKTNRLIEATSPYLLQHAHNPVDWYEWSPEAFEKAKTDDKPIFLSIGYAACHWCHVMEHESFESDVVADSLNTAFISIKVDREERPDIDEIYMAYTQARTGHGGWPMSVWLLPDGTPFFAGTYFPTEQFVDLLNRIDELWKTDREKITGSTKTVKDYFDEWTKGTAAAENVIPQSLVDQTAQGMARYYDRTRGGISGGGTNKFPPSMGMDLMLRSYRRTGNADLLEAVQVTLDNMARGGIYDHIGGGICRYSTDVDWLVPHFEKMLYDQAMVSAIYLDAFQVTKNPLYAQTAADIFDYVITDLQSPEGGFYSSRDADSEGLEGKFYLWTVDEIHRLLGDEDGKLFCSYYDVSETGNWFESRGHAPAGPKNILHITKPPELFCKLHQLDVNDFNKRLATWREKLRTERNKRVAPGLDDKILTSWNGLMIASLAKGGRVLNEPKYTQAAQRAASFVLKDMRKDGRLFATYRKGQSRLTGYLSDYAFLIDGLLNLYEADYNQKWLDEAVALADKSIEYYFDKDAGGFFFTASDGEKLIARSKQPHDNAIPAANSIHAMNLQRLAILFDRKDYREKAESIFRAFHDSVNESPSSFERLLCAVDFHHDRVKEIALVGPDSAPDTKELIRTIYDRYLPNKVVVHSPDKVEDTRMPLLKGKSLMNAKPTAYVCEKYTCQRPTTDKSDFGKQLDAK